MVMLYTPGRDLLVAILHGLSHVLVPTFYPSIHLHLRLCLLYIYSSPSSPFFVFIFDIFGLLLRSRDDKSYQILGVAPSAHFICLAG